MKSAVLVRVLCMIAPVILAACGGNGGGAGSEASKTPFVPTDPAIIAKNNHGVALMGQLEYAAARAVFQELVDAHPNWTDVRVNLAIAILNDDQEGDQATPLLQDIVAQHPDHIRARYCLGILLKFHGEMNAALEHFLFVAENDEADAHAAFNVGLCISQTGGGREEVLKWMQESRRRDPYLRAPYYRLQQLMYQAGRRAEAEEIGAAFDRLDKNPRARNIKDVYMRMGPNAEALTIDLAGAQSQPQPRPDGAIFGDPVTIDLGPQYAVAWSDRASITVADINNDKRLDIFIAGGPGVDGEAQPYNAVLIDNGQGAFTVEHEHPLATVAGIGAALWGDIDNDGLTDVYLCREGANQLWRQERAGAWVDVTEECGVSNGQFNTVHGALFDADHDSDLDIYCVNADGPNELLNNNNTFPWLAEVAASLNDVPPPFRPIARDSGLQGNATASRAILPVDIDSDRDHDLIILNQSPPHEVYENDRLWQYTPATGVMGLINADIVAICAGDVDADGRTELFSMAADGTIEGWSQGEDARWGSRWTFNGVPDGPKALPLGSRPGHIALADVTGDGRVNVISTFDTDWIVLDTSGMQAPNMIGGGFGPASAWSLAMRDPAGGPSMIEISDAQPRIWNAGSGRYPFTAVQLAGRINSGDQVRSNTSGIGVFGAARTGSRWTAFTTLGADSGPGQSLQPVALGLGGAPNIDFISIDWPDGVRQTEGHGMSWTLSATQSGTRNFTAGQLETIAEIQRLKSSCPVLFVWNGDEFTFVSDVLGVGGLGYNVGFGEYAQPRPWENFMLPGGVMKPRDGRFVIKINEPMEESVYLDAAKLVAWDLPPGWQMVLDERMGISRPEPTGEARFFRHELLPIAAVNDREEDVLNRVASADLNAAPVGLKDSRFIGRLRSDHVLTLQFDQPLDSYEGWPMLVADGWIEYPYSQTMFAAWQSGAEFRAPTIEARSTDGQWEVVLEQFGYPAGMPRRMSVPLINLPANTTELRISTNQEVYWDRLAVAWAEECPQVRRVEVPVAEVSMKSSLFPQWSVTGQQLHRFDYNNRAPLADTRHQPGLYTQFGSALPLIEAADSALAIIGPGEEVEMQFESGALAKTAPGWSREFVLELAGWCKDMDLMTEEGETLSPVPGDESSTNRKRLHPILNTRFESGSH